MADLNRSTRQHLNLRSVLALPMLAAAVMLSGCYEHVVSEKGLTRNQGTVYEPNVERDPSTPLLDGVERAIKGERKK